MRRDGYRAGHLPAHQLRPPAQVQAETSPSEGCKVRDCKGPADHPLTIGVSQDITVKVWICDTHRQEIDRICTREARFGIEPAGVRYAREGKDEYRADEGGNLRRVTFGKDRSQ